MSVYLLQFAHAVAAVLRASLDALTPWSDLSLCAHVSLTPRFACLTVSLLLCPLLGADLLLFLRRERNGSLPRRSPLRIVSVLLWGRGHIFSCIALHQLVLRDVLSSLRCVWAFVWQSAGRVSSSEILRTILLTVRREMHNAGIVQAKGEDEQEDAGGDSDGEAEAELSDMAAILAMAGLVTGTEQESTLQCVLSREWIPLRVPRGRRVVENAHILPVEQEAKVCSACLAVRSQVLCITRATVSSLAGTSSSRSPRLGRTAPCARCE